MYCRTGGKLLFGLFIVSLAFCLSQTSVFAANVAWVSFHAADDMPSTAAATAGFTEAPDKGYTDLLTSGGHNVTRIVTRGLPDPLTPDDEAYLANLNTFDLVILSRSVPSGNFQDPQERIAYHGLTTKLISMGGYPMRDNRLQFYTGNDIPDTSTSTAGPVTLHAVVPDHPIFDGIPLDGSDDLAYAKAVMFAPATTPQQRGISVVTNSLAGGGTVLGIVGAADEAASVGGTLIAYWAPGAMLGANVSAGHRMAFLSGSRESSGLTSEGSGIFDLTDEGGRLFLNAVDFMVAVPEPTSAFLLVFGIGVLGLRRKQ